MVFAFGFLLAGLIALAASTTPEQASSNLNAWLNRLKGAKPDTRLRNSSAPADATKEERDGG
jgi:hypothetical protein